MLASLPGVLVDDLTSHCCGMAGTSGNILANADQVRSNAQAIAKLTTNLKKQVTQFSV